MARGGQGTRDAEDGLGAGDRAQTEVIGVVLLLSIVVVGMTGIVVFGASAVGDTKQAASMSAAEHSMSQLDSKVSLVAHGDSTSQTVQLSGSSSAQRTIEPDRGWMNISIYDVSTDNYEETLTNTTLGVVRYEDGDATIAYQGGGVWMDHGESSTMLSPPEFHFRGDTLTLPLVTVAGDGSLSDGVEIVEGDGTEDVYPNASANRQNPLGQDQRIVVEIHSEHYGAWGRFFEQRTSGDVQTDDTDETAEITLVTPESDKQTVDGSIVATNSAGTLELRNGASIDSYNSSNASYATWSKSNASIVAAGKIELQNKMTLNGDVEAGGGVTLNNKAKITGNVSHGGPYTERGQAETEGWVASNGTVSEPSSVGGRIDSTMSDLQSASDNDNGNTSAIDSNRFDTSECTDASPCTLDGDEYYLSKVDLGSGKEVVIDTGGNEVEIAVDGELKLQNDATIRTVGGGTVRFYIDKKIQIQGQSNVSVPGQRAPGLWMYVDPNRQADIANQARFVGVIYGPGGSKTSSVNIEIKNKAEVFGGLVGKVTSVQNQNRLHFDEALLDTNVFGPGSDAPQISYLHVSTTPVNVTAA
jgi:hypothetical protein